MFAADKLSGTATARHALDDGGNDNIGGPYNCIAAMLVSSDCSQVARQISLNSANGACYCATEDAGWTESELSTNTNFNVWQSPSGSDISDGRCV